MAVKLFDVKCNFREPGEGEWKGYMVMRLTIVGKDVEWAEAKKLQRMFKDSYILEAHSGS